MNYESYVTLQKRYPRTICNDFLLPAELKKRFDGNVLTVNADEKALLLLEQRRGFIKLHFRLIDESATIAPQQQTIAAFLTYRDGRLPDAAARWLLTQGFIKTKTLRRHTALEITGEHSIDGIDYATDKEAFSMLSEYFNAVELDMPIGELFEGALCIRSSDEKPIGMLYMGQTLVVAVAAESRGQGLGQRLYRAYAHVKTQAGKKAVFHEWISPDNSASLAMFERLGFIADNVYTDCYIRASE